MSSIDLKSGLAAFFEQDHRDCDARWVDVEELLDTEDIESARPAWTKFEASLRRHIAMEEEVMFPAYEAATAAGDGPTAPMRMEHQQIIRLLGKIGKAVDAGKARDALRAGDTLLMLLQQHNATEEDVLYPIAEKVLGPDWAKLAARLEEY